MGNVARTHRMDENCLGLEISLRKETKEIPRYTKGNKKTISGLLKEPNTELLVKWPTRVEDLLKDIHFHSEPKPSRWSVTSVSISTPLQCSKDISRVLSLMNLKVLSVELYGEHLPDVCCFLSACLPKRLEKEKG